MNQILLVFKISMRIYFCQVCQICVNLKHDLEKGIFTAIHVNRTALTFPFGRYI